MFKRDIEKEVLDLARGYPVVTVVGPRQSGKTTLVRKLFADKPYVNLEKLDARSLAEKDPNAFLEQFPDGGVIDEIQRVPKLLSYIQVMVDEVNKPGYFILTGSHQLELHEAVSQSLAGRTALLTLYPMSLAELQDAKIEMSAEEAILTGFYPKIHRDKLDPSKAYRNYFQTYVERDVRQMINLKDLDAFQQFMKLCAGRVGQEVSFSNIANQVGVSYHTIKHWISILKASYLVFLLPPYYENLGKRVIKSPKLYFTDVGLACYLLEIENVSQVSRDPLRGGLFENLVVCDLFKQRLNQGRDPQMYFYRDSQQNEIDVIYKTGHMLIPIEIKSSKTFTTSFLKGLNYFDKLVMDRCEKGYLIYSGKLEQHVGKFKLLNYKNLKEIFSK